VAELTLKMAAGRNALGKKTATVTVAARWQKGRRRLAQYSSGLKSGSDTTVRQLLNQSRQPRHKNDLSAGVQSSARFRNQLEYLREHRHKRFIDW